MDIKLYVIPTCPYCKLVREFLTERGLTWEEIDVTASPTFNKQVEISAQFAVPVIDIDGKIIVGWNKAAIAEALKIHV